MSSFIVEDILSRIAYENAFDHLIITDIDGNILYANPAAEKLTGFIKPEMIGSKPKLWGGLMGPSWYQTFWHTIKDLKQPFVGEVVNKRKNGEKYNAEIRVNPVVDESGEVTHFVGIERDITEQKRIAQMKTDFLSLVSHQLRTPLGQINAYMDNMLSGVTGTFSPAQLDYLEGMKRSIVRCNRLVSNMLNISRIERGMIDVEIKTFNVDEIIIPLIQEFQPELTKKNITFNYSPQNIQILADKDKLNEVINNLIDNAIKHTNTGSISIVVENSSNQILIKVIDTGAGIASELIPELFSKEKVLSHAPAANEGAGLGLYLVKLFMNLQKGDVTVNSILNEGTTFILSLPKQ